MKLKTTIESTRFNRDAMAFQVAIICMMSGKEIPSEIDLDLRYGRTQDSTGSTIRAEEDRGEGIGYVMTPKTRLPRKHGDP